MAKKRTTVGKREGRQAITARKQRRRLARAAKPKKTAAGEMRRVDVAMKRLRQAYRLATARSEDVLAVANWLGDVAIQKHTNSLIRDLCEKQFLRDLIALRDSIAEVPTGSLTPRLESLRLLPDALIQWVEERFGLAPSGRAGEELEVPASRLAHYACKFALPTDRRTLIKVQVIAPGWKRGNTLLIPPRVRLAQEQTANDGQQNG